MSGKRKEINFFNNFSVFNNQELEQFLIIQDLLKTEGIRLRFMTSKNINPVNGLFGQVFNNENYDYHGIHHLLNSSGLFRGINNYTSQKHETIFPLETYNKIYLSDLDQVEISFPQIKSTKKCTLFNLTYQEQCPLNNKEIILKILEDGFLDIHMRLIKESEDSEIRKTFNKYKDQYFYFEQLIEPKMFEIQNTIKKNIKLINHCFRSDENELVNFPLLKHSEKLRFLYSRYNQEFDFLWLSSFLNNLSKNKNLDVEEFLKITEIDYKKFKTDSDNLIKNLQTLVVLEVF